MYSNSIKDFLKESNSIDVKGSDSDVIALKKKQQRASKDEDLGKLQ